MAAKTGAEFKLYYNSATLPAGYASPNWTEVCNVRDLTHDGTKNSADLSTRCGSGYRQKRGGLKEGKIEFEMIWDSEDTAQIEFLDRYEDGAIMHIADAEDDIGTAGTTASGGVEDAYYWHAPMTVTDFSLNQPLEEGVTVSVTLEVAFVSSQAPAWAQVTGS